MKLKLISIALAVTVFSACSKREEIQVENNPRAFFQTCVYRSNGSSDAVEACLKAAKEL